MYPILFQIGSVIVPSYGFMLAVAFIIGTLLIYKLGIKEGISGNKILELAIYINISAIIGARILFVLINYKKFILNPLIIFKISPEGLVFYGGFILAFLVGFWFIRKNQFPVRKMLDISSLSITLGLAVARVGCFLAGCCYGRECTLPWAVQFPPGSLAANRFGIPHHIHPVQLYSSFNALVIFLFLLYFRTKKRFDGQLFLSFLLLYSIIRIILEIFRGDINRGFIFFLSTSQFISLIVGIIAFFSYMRIKKLKN